MSVQPVATWQPHTQPPALGAAELSALVNRGARLYPQHIGDAQINDAILRRALAQFALYEVDARKVEAEFGLSPAAQVALGIRSAPHAVARLFAAHEVMKRYGDQAGHIAPLYRDADGVDIYTPSHGLIVPAVRGHLMRAWLHFKSAKDRAPHWVSSSQLPGGCKVVPAIHVVKSEHAHEARNLIVVAHTLEAEDFAASGIVTYVGMNGVTPAALGAQLRDEWPTLAGVTLALDCPSLFLIRTLERAGLKVRLA